MLCLMPAIDLPKGRTLSGGPLFIRGSVMHCTRVCRSVIQSIVMSLPLQPASDDFDHPALLRARFREQVWRSIILFCRRVKYDLTMCYKMLNSLVCIDSDIFLANVNSSSCSLYVVVRPSVCLSVVCRLSVCNVRAPYSGD